jgi:hypothetical protein
MISKVTLGSFLLALLLGLGILRWSLTHRDDCSRFLAGETRAPSSQLVVTGTRTVIIPCRVWLPRQPTSVQILCLVDFLFAVVFLLNAAGDLRANFKRRWHRTAHTQPD